MGFTTLTDDYLAEIGRITAHFSILESSVSEAIGLMLKLDERDVIIITAELTFRNKMNLFSSLYIERITDENLLETVS